MSRLAWTDPAPLEVERPRLPWWTLLPHRFLWAVSPIIAVVVVVMVVVFVIRRVWRYPVFLIGAAVLAGLGVGYSWWAPVLLAAGLAVAAGSWAWAHPDSFGRIAARQVRSEWRRALVYAWPWKRVMLFSDLVKHTGHRQRRTHYPRLRRVRAEGWRDRVSVRLLHGQCAAIYAAHAAELANSFGARSCRVRVDKPRRIWLDFVHTDPLAQPLPVPSLAEPGTGVDLAQVVIGRTETGRPWLLRLADRHALVAGVSDAGKSSVMWAVLRALAPGIRSGLGRAPGVCVIGQLRDPRKEIIDFRHLFPTKIAMRLDEPTQVDMVLGDGVRERGAAAHEISEDTPGVAWAKIDGRRDPDRARAFHTTDADLDELCDYVGAGRHDAPCPLTAKEVA